MSVSTSLPASTELAAIQARYPHLSAQLQAQLAAYDRQVATFGHQSTLNAPIIPDRIRALHPFAN